MALHRCVGMERRKRRSGGPTLCEGCESARRLGSMAQQHPRAGSIRRAQSSRARSAQAGRGTEPRFSHQLHASSFCPHCPKHRLHIRLSLFRPEVTYLCACPVQLFSLSLPASHCCHKSDEKSHRGQLPKTASVPQAAPEFDFCASMYSSLPRYIADVDDSSLSVVHYSREGQEEAQKNWRKILEEEVEKDRQWRQKVLRVRLQHHHPHSIMPRISACMRMPADAKQEGRQTTISLRLPSLTLYFCCPLRLLFAATLLTDGVYANGIGINQAGRERLGVAGKVRSILAGLSAARETSGLRRVCRRPLDIAAVRFRRPSAHPAGGSGWNRALRCRRQAKADTDGAHEVMPVLVHSILTWARASSCKGAGDHDIRIPMPLLLLLILICHQFICAIDSSSPFCSVMISCCCCCCSIFSRSLRPDADVYHC